MTIASTVLPAATARTYAHRSPNALNNAPFQSFTVIGQALIDNVQVAGREGETALRVLIWSSVNGAPSEVAHSRVGIVPTVSGADNTIYDLSFDQFILPPGDFFLQVEGENTDWAWFGEKGAGWPSTAQLSFLINETTPTVGAGQRWYRAGVDAFGWAVGQIGTPGSEWNQGAAHKEVDPESAAITAGLDSAYSGGFLSIGMGKNKTSGEHFVASILEVDNSTPVYEYMPKSRAVEALRTGSETLSEDFHLDPHSDRTRVKWPATGRLDGVGGPSVIQNENGVEPVLEPTGDAHGYKANKDTGEIEEDYSMDGPGLPAGFGPGEFSCGTQRTYDLTKEIASYEGDDCCTSANARGGAYIPFLFEADDVIESSGDSFNHCLAFTNPNGFTRANDYWGEATHTPLRTPQHTPLIPQASALPYGAHMRLKDSFVINPAWPPALRSILKTLKLYGMKHVDGSDQGQLVATNDRYSTVTNGWDNVAVGMNPNDLTIVAGLTWLDFEVLVPANNEKKDIQACECRRTPPTPEFRTW